MSPNTQAILWVLRSHGICTSILNQSELSGDAFKLSTDTGDVFVKTSNRAYAYAMFEGEIESLNAILEAVPGFAPKPLCLGTFPNG
ncbi:5648_t:CDS:2, partial [Funneliformis mosseae]